MSNRGDKHLKFDDRKTIEILVKEGKKPSEIARRIGTCLTTIYNEVKNNRRIIIKGSIKDSDVGCKTCLLYKNCKHKKICGRFGCLGYCKYCGEQQVAEQCIFFKKIKCMRDKFPYTCTKCKLKSSCLKDKYEYDAKVAEEMYRAKLVIPRLGKNLTDSEAIHLSHIVKNGLENKLSPYIIVKNYPDLPVSARTIYNYIKNGFFKELTDANLPVGIIKKRKTFLSRKYLYGENVNINRNNREYLNFIKAKMDISNGITHTVEMDFLGAPRESEYELLVLAFKELNFILIYPFKRGGNKKVSQLFDEIEQKLGQEVFKKIFPCILTDRDSRFNDFESIEKSVFGECTRTKVFYCDPGVSNQKAFVENVNKQLRLTFEKSFIFKHITVQQCNEIASNYNCRKLRNLGARPFDVFKEMFGEYVLQALDITEINAENLSLKNKK